MEAVNEVIVNVKGSKICENFNKVSRTWNKMKMRKMKNFRGDQTCFCFNGLMKTECLCMCVYVLWSGNNSNIDVCGWFDSKA